MAAVPQELEEAPPVALHHEHQERQVLDGAAVPPVPQNRTLPAEDSPGNYEQRSRNYPIRPPRPGRHSEYW